VTVGGEDIESCITALSRKGVPLFGDVYEAIACLGSLYGYQRYLSAQTDSYEEVPIDIDPIEAVCRKALRENRYFLLAHEAQKIMDIIGIAVPKTAVARNLAEAIDRAEAIGYPVVMKIVSRDIIHKSDAGGVALDLENKDEVIDAYQAIMSNCKAHDPNAHLEGVEIAEMIKKDIETVVGARRDAVFGPVIMCGLGGIYIEVLKDVAFRACPLSRREIMNMIKETKSYPLLLGVRGEEKKDMETFVRTIVKISSLIRKSKTISDIEINPLMVYEQGLGAKAVDVRILLSTERGS
jgi:acyl-CoA synthetase (NDP forming)